MLIVQTELRKRQTFNERPPKLMAEGDHFIREDQSQGASRVVKVVLSSERQSQPCQESQQTQIVAVKSQH